MISKMEKEMCENCGKNEVIPGIPTFAPRHCKSCCTHRWRKAGPIKTHGTGNDPSKWYSTEEQKCEYCGLTRTERLN